MKFVIETVAKEIVKPGYFVDIDCMFGDADGFEHVKIGPFNKDNEVAVAALELLVKMLDRIALGHYDEFISEDVPEIRIWCDNVDYEYKCDDVITDGVYSEEVCKFIEGLKFSWPFDYMCDRDAHLSEYTITYHDGTAEYPVNVIYDDDEEYEKEYDDEGCDDNE